jgi:hypothetical protein
VRERHLLAHQVGTLDRSTGTEREIFAWVTFVAKRHVCSEKNAKTLPLQSSGDALP